MHISSKKPPLFYILFMFSLLFPVMLLFTAGANVSQAANSSHVANTSPVSASESFQQKICQLVINPKHLDV